MSIGKVSTAGNLKDFEGLTIEQIKEKVCEKFYTVYGRYENVSGKMWVELYHKDTTGDSDYSKGQVIWRKGIKGQDELLEDMVLERIDAIAKFADIANKGYSEVFKGITQSDMDKGNAKRLENRTQADLEGWLGTYYKGNKFFRINEFTPTEFYLEWGFGDNTVYDAKKVDYDTAKTQLEKLKAEGYSTTKSVTIEDSGFPDALLDLY